MRWSMIVAAGCVACLGGSAQAAENYVSRGHSYAPGSEALPPLNSARDRLDLDTDILEADIYVKQREQKVFESLMNRFSFQQEIDSTDLSPEY